MYTKKEISVFSNNSISQECLLNETYKSNEHLYDSENREMISDSNIKASLLTELSIFQ